MQIVCDNSMLIFQCTLPCKLNQPKINEQFISPAQIRQRIQYQKIFLNENILMKKKIHLNTQNSQPKRNKTTTSVQCKRSLKKYKPKQKLNPQFQHNKNREPPLLKYQKTFKQFTNNPLLVDKINNNMVNMMGMISHQCSNKDIKQINHKNFPNYQKKQIYQNVLTQSSTQNMEINKINKNPIRQPIYISPYTINLQKSKEKKMTDSRVPLQFTSLNSSQRKLQNIGVTQSDELSIYEPNQQYQKIIQNDTINKQLVFSDFFDRQFVHNYKEKQNRKMNKQQEFLNKKTIHKRILGNCTVKRVQSIVDSNPQIQYSDVVRCSKLTLGTNQKSIENLNFLHQPKQNILLKNSFKQLSRIQ